MTDLEKRADEYASKFWFDTSTDITKPSVKELLIKFAQSETELLSKHLIEMQKTNGALTDRVNELENKLVNIRYYLDNEIPHEFINEATNIIYKMV